MKTLHLFWLITGFGFYGCDDPAKITGEREAIAQNKNVTTNEIVTNSKAYILHNIIVQETGSLKIARAYLSFEDGKLLPKTNTVSLGDPVYLNLLPDKSWLAKKGKVSIDASQKIITNKGELVLDTSGLFGTLPPVDRSRFNRISLQAAISKIRLDIDYFIIYYRV